MGYTHIGGHTKMHPGVIGGIVGSVVGLMGGIIGTYFSIKNTNSPEENLDANKN